MNNWKYISQIRGGLLHIKEGSTCQDHMEILENETGLAATLADGVGMFSRSEVASDAATKAAVKWLLHNGPEVIRKGDLDAIREKMLPSVRWAVEISAREKDVEGKLDCNLVFVYISGSYAILGQLGDCALALAGKHINRVITDTSGAYGTASVLSSRAEKDLQVEIIDLDAAGISTIILTSDGLENLIYRKNGGLILKYAETFINQLPEAKDSAKAETKIQQLLDALVQKYPNELDDDISLIILSRAEQAITLPEDPTWLCTCESRNNVWNDSCHNCGKDFVAVYPKLRLQGKPIDLFFADYNKDSVKEMQLLLNQQDTPKPQPVEPIRWQEQPDTQTKRLNVDQVDMPTLTKEDESVPIETSGQSFFVGTITVAEAVGEKNMELPKKKAVQSTKMDFAEGLRASAAKQETTKANIHDQGQLFNNCELAPIPEEPVQKKSDEASNHVRGDRKTSGAHDWNQTPEASRKTAQKMPADKMISWDYRNGDGKNGSSKVGYWIPVVVLALLVVLGGIILLLRGYMTKPQNDLPRWQTLPGGYYSGPMKNGLPHGVGIWMDDEYYYIGTLSDGRKEGSFIVISREDAQDVKIAWYEDDEQISQEQKPVAPTVEVPRTVKIKSVRLREKPGYNSKSTQTRIQQGETVYQIQQEPVLADGVKWVQVRTEYGDMGWCDAETLEPVE